MGGTFNPIHCGHITIAEIAHEALGLDKVLFMPDGTPPHKEVDHLASAVSRFNMTALAIWGENRFTCSELEILRDGVTYTVDTLATLKQAYPNASLHYIVGADVLFTVERWRETERVAQLCSLVAAPRRGIDEQALHSQIRHLHYDLGYSIAMLPESAGDISSTDIRRRLANGESLAGLVPQPVWDYITQHALYGAPPHQMLVQLSRTLSPLRLSHTLSVAETSVRLAARFGENPCQAHLAGMLHDCAKGLDAPSLLQLIRSGGIPTDDMELSMPALLHAPAGASLAKSQYHVTDASVLSAIRWHTTGRKNMTKLEKIIYLADVIEPERADFPGLSEIRELALTDLDRAVSAAAARSAAYVSERGKKLHPRTIELARDTQ